MASYYVNTVAQPNGDHEVHRDGCSWMPSTRNYLGQFTTCHEAVREAKRTYPKADGCYHCSLACHTS